MKNVKSMVLGCAVLVGALLCVGAGATGDARPPGVPAERWISIGDRAGFVITTSNRSATVGAELFLKTDKGWRRARVENPVHVYPVAP